jgi:nucleoside-diphosphate-sugar epimerase
MRVLVLGSEGQIGKPLCIHLEEQGHHVRHWDKVISKSQNLADPEYYGELCVEMHMADKVIFLAFEVGGSKFLAKADKNFEYIDENVSLMCHTFAALKYTKTPFLFASSQMANMHHTNYGFLKDLGERYTRSLGGWICRFWNVFGVEECEEEKLHVITDFLLKAQQGKIEMRTTGTESRQFLHTEDCSRALESWVDGEWDDRTQYYDITSFEWVSILDVAKTVQGIVGGEVVPGEKEDTLQRGIKNPPSEYIRKFWEPDLSLEEGIKMVYYNL